MITDKSRRIIEQEAELAAKQAAHHERRNAEDTALRAAGAPTCSVGGCDNVARQDNVCLRHWIL